MNDQELARAILEKLRESRSPSRVEDLVSLGRDSGAEGNHQIMRVVDELERRGLLADYDQTEQAIFARISDQGVEALDRGGPDFEGKTAGRY